jgi:hypothetical protein
MSWFRIHKEEVPAIRREETLDYRMLPATVPILGKMKWGSSLVGVGVALFLIPFSDSLLLAVSLLVVLCAPAIYRIVVHWRRQRHFEHAHLTVGEHTATDFIIELHLQDKVDLVNSTLQLEVARHHWIDDEGERKLIRQTPVFYLRTYDILDRLLPDEEAGAIKVALPKPNVQLPASVKTNDTEIQWRLKLFHKPNWWPAVRREMVVEVITLQ